jgi:hypothetical protein
MEKTEIQEMITLQKTAMQEMIAYFEIFKGQDKSNQAMPLGIAISIAKSLLEQEKEQIVDAFREGVGIESNHQGAGYLDKEDAEKYFSETFIYED